MKRVLLALAVMFFVASCASQPAPLGIEGNPGFFLGLWHGFIAPFAIVGHIFDSDVRMYAFPNSGGWYDFGFLLGICIWGGGGSAASSRRY